MPFIILLTLFLFFFSVATDTLTKVADIDKTLTEQAKVCLAEFSKKNCDSLNLSDACKSLLKCVQKEDSDTLSRIHRYLSVFI